MAPSGFFFSFRARERAKTHWTSWLSSTFLEFNTAVFVYARVCFSRGEGPRLTRTVIARVHVIHPPLTRLCGGVGVGLRLCAAGGLAGELHSEARRWQRHDGGGGGHAATHPGAGGGIGVERHHGLQPQPESHAGTESNVGAPSSHRAADPLDPCRLCVLYGQQSFCLG